MLWCYMETPFSSSVCAAERAFCKLWDSCTAAQENAPKGNYGASERSTLHEPRGSVLVEVRYTAMHILYSNVAYKELNLGKEVE